MTYQSMGLLLIFLIGSLASCFQFFQGQIQATSPPESIKSITPSVVQSQGDVVAADAPSDADADAASALLDRGQGAKPSKMFHEILQNDLKNPDKKMRVAVDLNNEAVALYLSARLQADRKRAQELLLLARNCFATAQALAQKLDLSQTQMAVSYNQYMLIDLLGDHSRATRMLDIASKRRRDLKPTLSKGLLP